ncbi:MAG: amidase family protein [Tepidisphaeraceae bacterium]
MAYSYDGVDNSIGQIRNPYNPNRTPGGSSSGTGSGIASNLALAGMGGETGGSIRVPASADALVGLKTSLGLIDPSGTWPLTPSRDVVGPLTKSVKDAAIMMNALVGTSSTNLFNNTPFYPSSGAQPGAARPADYTAGLSTTALQGKVLAVPKAMVNMTSATATTEGTVNSTVLAQFNTAVAALKAQGAKVIYVDIPASTKYYNTIGKSGTPTTTGFGYDYPTTTVGGTTPSSTWSSWAAAYYYNELIKSYNDPVIHNLNDFATALNNGRNGAAGSPLSTLNSAYTNINNLAVILNAGNAKGFGDADNNGQPDNPDAIKALQAFADLRKNEFEGFMAAPNLVDDPLTLDVDESTITKIDAFVAPTYGTVQSAVTASQRLPGVTLGTYSGGSASLLGRFESNILGGPALSVPMGYFSDGTPMGIQFFGELLSEQKLLQLGYAYEQSTSWRTAPNLDLLIVAPEPTTLAAIGGVLMLTLRRRREMSTTI